MEQPQFPNPAALQRVRRDLAWREVPRTIKYAHIRCLPRTEIISRVCDPQQADHLAEYISRLFEFKLSDSELKALVSGMEELAHCTETAPAALKTRIDRTLLRLVRILPSELAVRFAEPYIIHPRKARRRWAYTALREKQISETIATGLIDTFCKTGDQEALNLVARNPQCVAGARADFLLTNLTERYWRARVLEALLIHDRPAAIAQSRHYPFEFAHAVGRTGDASLLQELRALFTEYSDDPEFISIYAYALGKISAEAELESLERLIQEGRLANDTASDGTWSDE